MRENKKDLKFRLGLFAAAALLCAMAFAEGAKTPTMTTVTAGTPQATQVSVARYVTNIVMQSSSNWERVDANLPDSVYYKLALETVTVTGGVRRFETKDYFINVSVTNYTTNLVFYTPYKELDHKVYLKVNPPKLDTPDMVELIEQLPKVTLRELEPPKPPKQDPPYIHRFARRYPLRQHTGQASIGGNNRSRDVNLNSLATSWHSNSRSSTAHSNLSVGFYRL